METNKNHSKWGESIKSQLNIEHNEEMDQVKAQNQVKQKNTFRQWGINRDLSFRNSCQNVLMIGQLLNILIIGNVNKLSISSEVMFTPLFYLCKNDDLPQI